MQISRGPAEAGRDRAPAAPIDDLAAGLVGGVDAAAGAGSGPRLQTKALFVEQVARHLSLSARKAVTFVVLFIDLGVAVGDERFEGTVDRLRAQMRSHEALALVDDATLATLLEDCSEAQATAAVERLSAAVEEGNGLQAQVKFGAAVGPTHGRTPQTVMQAAANALAAAKQASAPELVFFQARAMRGPAQAADATDDLLVALKTDGIMLALQPVVHADTRLVAFYEGLVRIRRPDGEIVMPDTLVPHAEKNGVVTLLDRRVIEIAFGLLTADRKLNLSVNASVTSLGDPRWVDQLRSGCRLRPDAARRLTVEITETRAIADVEATRETLAALKPLGIKVAIDDFGSGHSSFRNLRQLPIDFLKIDGAFAQNLASSADDRFFTRALVDLARNLGIPTVAEWVEDEETARILMDWGVAYLQGHLFGRAEIAPMPTSAKRGAPSS